ncbi:hypothetical protein KIN20_020181 [Parelaphostrongylus tenuis]|uniref:Uncharacterized protein n=1 Tax=Parelaphostrongylus tenuis TaxID=148309 RepID=A0AAD5QTH0_PARTN|nr:hypothetical protein KIN20_020181 [Parelaphostrongylus tenuis]
MLDLLRKRLSLRLFKTKDEQYHPHEEERIEAQRAEERARAKRERSRLDGPEQRFAPGSLGLDWKNTKSKHDRHHHYKKKELPSYSSLENAIPSSFHRSAPVCRRLREHPKNVN